ncbi:palladin-like [Nycticebus coucang]|uniref:palladin-like n=1 Tax=Nycticebus coucang TaxID=9470 RepID=UPI00234D3B6E|nr:palladin-like [Nycticebus coucang]
MGAEEKLSPTHSGHDTPPCWSTTRESGEREGRAGPYATVLGESGGPSATPAPDLWSNRGAILRESQAAHMAWTPVLCFPSTLDSERGTGAEEKLSPTPKRHDAPTCWLTAREGGEGRGLFPGARSPLPSPPRPYLPAAPTARAQSPGTTLRAADARRQEPQPAGPAAPGLHLLRCVRRAARIQSAGVASRDRETRKAPGGASLRQGGPLHSRWFCDGKELLSSPDIQICVGGDLHTLVIAEAFEDDTGHYTCLATNPSGSDSTSAEVFIEGASSTDSDSESSAFKLKPGVMPQAQKKTTSVSLTSVSKTTSSPKTGVTTAVIQPLSAPIQQVQSPTSYLCRSDGTTAGYFPPVFVKEFQNTAVVESQVVVLECRARGAPPLQVQWFRQGSEIQDSPDFRILQKKPRSTAEPETFPEDTGIITCLARNEYGLATSTAQLFVISANTENYSCNSAEESSDDHFQHFPSFAPVLETDSPKLASKRSSEVRQGSSPKSGLSTAALHTQCSSAEREINGVHLHHGVNGLINGKVNDDRALPAPAVLPSPSKEPPPLLAKPKL